MSLTMKVVEVIDKLKLDHYFIEKENAMYFSPIKIKLNTDVLEDTIDKLVSSDGKAYRPNQFERDVLKDLDF